MKDERTLNYYSRQADQFIESTMDVSFDEMQNAFLALLDEGGTILDLGCGSGRDSLAFQKAGFHVLAADACLEMVRHAQSQGLPSRLMSFDELDDKDEYDGVWACSSLLHVPKNGLPDIFARIERALKPGGIFYCSFKYGKEEGYRNGRYFTDLTDEELSAFMKNTGLCEISLWKTADVRKGRQAEFWLNALYQKPFDDDDKL